MSRIRRGWPFYRQLLLEDENGPAALLSLSDEIERRGVYGEDVDPCETAEWLRSEVEA